MRAKSSRVSPRARQSGDEPVRRFCLASAVVAAACVHSAPTLAQSNTEPALWCIGQARSGGQTTWYSSEVAAGVLGGDEAERRWITRVQQRAPGAVVRGECHASTSAAAAELRRYLWRQEVGEAPWADLAYRPGSPVNTAPALATEPAADETSASELAAAAERRARIEAITAAADQRRREQEAARAAAQARFERETAAVEASRRQYQIDLERVRREQAAVDADRQRYEREMIEYRAAVARVEACRAGDRSQCPPRTPQ